MESIQERQLGDEAAAGKDRPGPISRWQMIQLPVLLIVLLGGMIWLNYQQSLRDQDIADAQHALSLQIATDQQQEALLLNYMNSVSDMLLHDKLLESHPMDVVNVVANARTLETLRKLDPDRKAAVMRFLYGTKLITNDHRTVSMIDSDFTNAHLHAIDLRDSDLLGTNFSKADLSSANLSFCLLGYVNFRGANLTGADLHDADMNKIDVSDANLMGANLKDAINIGTDQLTKAKSLKGAIMPDGTIHP